MTIWFLGRRAAECIRYLEESDQFALPSPTMRSVHIVEIFRNNRGYCIVLCNRHLYSASHGVSQIEALSVHYIYCYMSVTIQTKVDKSQWQDMGGYRSVILCIHYYFSQLMAMEGQAKFKLYAFVSRWTLEVKISAKNNHSQNSQKNYNVCVYIRFIT